MSGHTEVALLAEGVDRNILLWHKVAVIDMVALLAEGVDRNKRDYTLLTTINGRPPRGGRG